MPLTNPQRKALLQKIRSSYPWTANYTDEVLLRTIQRTPDAFNREDIKWFVWGADPITGKALPTVGQFLTGPIVSGILVAIIALFFVSKMK